MQKIIYILKELIVEFYFNFIRWKKKSENNKNILSSLYRDGISTVPDFLSDEKCLKYIKIIDACIEDSSINTWVDGEGADNRIYFINEINAEMNEFYENKFIRSVLYDYLGVSNPVGMLLAAKINFKNGNLGSGGGWHRDSPVRNQFKAICYLNDVGTYNGPFQYIKASHKFKNVISSYVRSIFKAGQYRFKEDEVDKYCKYNKTEVSDMTAEHGTLVFADTKGIHRGKPVEEGSRYVLFCYFWDKTIPPQFTELKQKK